MLIENSVAFITGSNRGIGRALVQSLLENGVAKVYAAARDITALGPLISDPRVVPIALDVTDPAAIQSAAAGAMDVTLLINNAGVLDFGAALETEVSSFTRQMDVNFYGPLAVTGAFAPIIETNGGGAVVNLLSVVSLSSMSALAAYSASKAAAWSLTQSLRVSLAARRIAVHAVFPGPIDTDMATQITLPKTSPADAARAIVAGIAEGQEDIFPDVMSKQVYAGWAADHKEMERQFAAM